MIKVGGKEKATDRTFTAKTNQSNPLSKLWYGGCITWYGIGTLSFVDGNIDAEKYLDTLEENLWPIIARHFPTGGEIFQDDGTPVPTTNIVKTGKRKNGINSPVTPPPPPPAPRS